jgi:hypothetical protein
MSGMSAELREPREEPDRTDRRTAWLTTEGNLKPLEQISRLLVLHSLRGGLTVHGLRLISR